MERREIGRAIRDTGEAAAMFGFLTTIFLSVENGISAGAAHGAENLTGLAQKLYDLTPSVALGTVIFAALMLVGQGIVEFGSNDNNLGQSQN